MIWRTLTLGPWLAWWGHMGMKSGFLFLSLAAFGAACGGAAPSEDRSCSGDVCTESATGGLCPTIEPFSMDIEDWPTIDGVLADVALRNPGFGGFRFETDRLVVLMVNPTQAGAEAIRDELVGIYGSSRMRRSAVTPQSTAYDYVELLTFYVRARNVLGLDGVVWSDINESQGRIEYGVVDDETAACVSANIQQLTIPTSAVLTQRSEPIRPLGN